MSGYSTDPTLDVTSDLSGVYIKRADVEHGDYRFVIAAASRETFEARDGKPAQTRVVLTSADTPPRKFPLNKVNLRTLVTAWGTIANRWIGQTIWIHHDPTVEVGGVVKGGQRVRIPSQAPPTPPANTLDLQVQAQIQALKAQLAAQAPVATREPGDDAPTPTDDDIAFSMPTVTGD
jgi:hypothetical protein